MEPKPALERLISTIESLPPISSEMRDLFIAATQNIEDINTKEFVSLVERSPAVAAKLIGLANSAFFRRGKPVTSIKEAIIRSIGLRTACHITASLITSSSLDISKCKAFDAQAYWLRALYVAGLNKRLCLLSNKKHLSADTAYLSGLLFNLGELVLATVTPEAYSECLSQSGKDDLQRLDIEQQILGLDSTMAGSIVAINWALPMVIANVTMHHVTPLYNKDDWEYSLITHLSSLEHENAAGYRAIPAFLNRLFIDEEAYNTTVKAADENAPQLMTLARLFS